MKEFEDWDDEELKGRMREAMLPQEEVPPQVRARTQAALAARLSAMTRMNWRVTTSVSAAATVVMLAYGSQTFTIDAVVATAAVGMLYAFTVKTLVTRSA